MNELMAEFRGKDLLSKKKKYVAYLDKEWGDLARKKNLTDETLKNIVVDVEQDKSGLEWLVRRIAPLNYTQWETDLAPSIYVQAVEKFAKVKVHSADATPLLHFTVEVAATLKDVLANLPTIERSSKPEVVVIFLYNTHEENLYVRHADVLAFNAHILREEDNQEEYMYNPPRTLLLAPMIFICKSVGIMNVQVFAANSQTRVWSTHHTLYLFNTKRTFRKLVMDP